MKNYFQATPDSPAHISVGAVVVNSDGKIACHHFDEIRGYTDLYVLMRESLEMHESLEAALQRGLMEEFGMKATLITFLGTIVAYFNEHGFEVEKTTLYFFLKYNEHNEAWRLEGDPERGSTITFYDPDKLISIMQKQGKRIPRKDADESEIIKRAVVYLEKQHG